MNVLRIRRNLRRISERKGITFTQAILRFYRVERLDQLDKKLVWSLMNVKVKIPDERPRKMDFSEIVPKFAGSDLYVYMTEENPDWSADDPSVELVVHYGGRRAILPMVNTRDVSYLASAMHHFVNPDSLVLSWCVKDVFSFLKGRTGISVEPQGNIYDLQIVCSYFGYPKERPSNFKEALAILRRASGEEGWPVFKKFYDAVYKPLFSRVVPDMETCCLADNGSRSCVYPSYVIEGQVNGRLKAVRTGLGSYNPHSLGPVERSRLRPPDYEQCFVYFDYRNMEVSVLRWLSGDEHLGAIIDSGADPYKEIWRRITGSEPSDSQRLLCKSIFLPVVFGQGVASLAKKAGISEKTARMVIDNLVKTFPVAFDWIESKSHPGDNSASDIFGRRRYFESNELYKIRNFCIQSPASMICLRKLVKLHEELSDKARLCFHVHDGYCVVCKRQDVDHVCKAGISTLQSEDELFPGLSLRVSCESGDDLDNMQTHRKVQFS